MPQRNRRSTTTALSAVALADTLSLSARGPDENTGTDAASVPAVNCRTAHRQAIADLG